MTAATQPILPSPASSRVIRELDGLRGIAIGLVMLHHLWPTKGALARLAPLADLGWIGVDLFFVISGALITGILLDSRGRPAYFKNFYARRALRIFPLYYAFIAAVFALPLLREGWHGAFTEHSGSPLWYLFYLGNAPEAFFGKDPPYFLAILWSLAIEEQFYISFPFVVAALSRKALTRVLAALVVLVPVLRAILTVAWPENARLEYLFIFCRADVIALGGLIAIAVRDPAFQPRRRTLDLALAGGMAMMVAAFALGGLDRETAFGRTLGYSVTAFAFAALVLWTLANRETPRARVLRFAPLCYVGELCYGLYLLHRPADTLTDRLFERLDLTLPPAALLLVKLAASVAIAMVSWYAFEKPILRLKRLFARDGSARPGSPVWPPELTAEVSSPAPSSRCSSSSTPQ